MSQAANFQIDSDIDKQQPTEANAGFINSTGEYPHIA